MKVGINQMDDHSVILTKDIAVLKIKSGRQTAKIPTGYKQPHSIKKSKGYTKFYFHRYEDDEIVYQNLIRYFQFLYVK